MDSANTLGIHWAFGFSKSVVGGVQNLTTSNRNAIFFVSSHSGVIYDYENRSQMILQGHTHVISCCAVSSDKRWIVTADQGDESILVVWDSFSGVPVKTFFAPHVGGTCSVDISSDCLYLTTLSAPVEGIQQEVALWAWTKEGEGALLKATSLSSDVETCITFDPSNAHDIVTTASKNVTFWSWANFNLEGYVGNVNKSDVGYFSGKFTLCTFLPGTGSVLTATSDGYVILWENAFSKVLMKKAGDKTMKSAAKVVKLVDCGIITIFTVNGYVVLGCTSGSVRFYDFSLRLEAWFDDFAAGPVTSVSFCLQSCPFPEGEGGAPGLQFWVPDFMVGTSDAFIVGVESNCFGEVKAEDRRGTLLMQGFSEEVCCIACHPSRPLLALGCSNGSLQIWDYEMKLLMNLREFNFTDDGNNLSTKKKLPYLKPTCFEFEPSGAFLSVGFSNGQIKYLNVDTLEDTHNYSPSQDSIIGICFSKSGTYMAAYDKGCHVCLFTKGIPEVEEDQYADEDIAPPPAQFIFTGRAVGHGKSVVGLTFGVREGGETLISIGEDRRCVEYDLVNSSISAGLKCTERPASIEQVARPTALAWMPRVGEDTEDKFFIANEDFKIKEFNSESKQCRKTTLAPVFGGPPCKLVPLPTTGTTEDGTQTGYYAYATPNKVVGIGALPLTGNPKCVMGLVAHPDVVSAMAISCCGQFMFTAGGPDLSTNMWDINTSKLPIFAPTVNTIGDFLDMLEGGQGGDVHNDIIDFFYYSQLRSQGEDAIDDRRISGKVFVDELPQLVRAIGFYPSEEEISNMVNEVRYRHFMVDGLLDEEINIDDFIKLHLNHRPVVPLSLLSIQAAFEKIQASGKGDMNWASLKHVLTTEGEAFSEVELESCMASLIGACRPDDEPVEVEGFTNEILGFEDFGSEEQ